MAYVGVKPAAITSATQAEISGDLTVDTNTLHVDAANNRVGIGTLSPDRSLHITNSEPSIVLENSGQGTDLKTWRIYSNSSSLQVGTVDDAFAAGQNALEITRDNTDNITGIQFKTGASSEIGRFTTDGLTFNGDTAAANALDDYEEGQNLSATVRNISGTALTAGTDYSIETNKYTKIGRMVFGAVRLRDLRSSKDDLEIDSPFTLDDGDRRYGSHFGGTGQSSEVRGSATVASTRIRFRGAGEFKYGFYMAFTT